MDGPPPPTPRPLLNPYVVALLATVAAALLRIWLEPVFGERFPYVTFCIAVVVSAWQGGLWPALLSTVVGTVCALYFIIPARHGFARSMEEHALGLSMFVLVCLAIAVFGEMMWIARRRAVRSSELLRETLESISDGFMRFDAEWRVVYVNAEAERTNGIPRSETLGRRLWDLFPDIVGTRLEAEYRRCVAEQTTVEMENFYEPHGRWYALRISPSPGGGAVVFYRDIHDQKQQRDALDSATARLRHLADAMPQIVYSTSPDGRVEFINGRWREYTGAGFSGSDDLVAFVHPDDLRGLVDLWTVAMAKAVPLECEFRLRGADGGYRWFLTRSVPVCDAGGRIVQWYGTSTDIHLQKLAEERIRASEEQYRTLFESMDEGYCVVEVLYADGRPFDLLFLETNPAFAKQSGLEGARGRRVSELVPGLESAWVEAYGGVAATGVPVRFESQAEPLGRWFEVSASRSGDSATRRVSILFNDITARKKVEESLRQKVEELETLMDTIPVGVFVAHDPECRTITGNPAARAMLRAATANLSKSAPDGARPTNFRALYHGVEVPPQDLPVQRAARGEQVRDAEVDDVFDDGTVLHTLMSAAPLHDDQGRVRGAVATMLDVTERKRAENALRDADRRKDEFLATLAHELRNPLAPIRNGLQILRLAKLEGPLEQTRTMMDRQLAQLVRLVDDLLDVSRITLGKMELRRERVELRGVIETALEVARPGIELAGHRLHVDLPGELILLHGDSTRLAQVVANLLNNAGKYTTAGGEIRLSAQRDGETAVVTVSDNGIGIPPAMLTRVFDLFTQVDRRLEKTTGGLGIGLSLVKGLVEMHGGTVSAESAGEGQGSVFALHLPALPAERIEPAPPATGEATAVPRRHRLLVVDDNADSADSLGMLLELLGHEVRTVYDGEAGIAEAEGYRPDAVLMDIGMPKVNGYEAARRIRSREWGKALPLVALTGWGQADDRQKSAEAGFDHHLVKPVEAAILMKLLDGLGS